MIRVVHDIETGKLMLLDKDEGTVAYRADLYELTYTQANDVFAITAFGANVDELEKQLEEQNLFSDMTPEEKKFLQDMAFGRSFITKILNQVKTLDGLTIAQRLTLLNTIKDAMNTLLWGDVEVSRAAFNATATTALFTQPRKDWVLEQLDGYLNQ